MALRRDMFINGRWVAGAGVPFEVINPATEEPVTDVPSATEEELADAIASTGAAAAVWAAVSQWERSAMLRRIGALMRERADELAPVLTAEQGKPFAEARGEVLVGAEYFDWYADEARRIYGRVVEGRTSNRRLIVMHEPVGPVAAFTPNNFPWALPARKVAAALAAGCSVLLKPAEDTPLSSIAMAEVCADAGLPAGVLNVITGDPAVISATVLSSPIIRKVSVTGSTVVGKILLKLSADTVKRASLELGGHAPVLVLADADPIKAAQAAATSKFRNCGQVCVAPSRFLVADAIYDDFVEELVRQTKTLTMGPGDEPGTEVGPLVSDRRVKAVEELVEDARAKGATIAAGGRRPNDRPVGYYYEPTVITDLTPDMRVLSEEPFGPIAPVLRYSQLDEAIRIANSVDVGLAGYVFGTDVIEADRVARRLEVGMVSINSFALATPEAPFGGIKQSGYGSEGGTEGILDYLSVRYVNAPC